MFIQGRALQFDQWRIVHLAEFGICNFSEVSPSSFNKKSTNSGSDSPPPAKAAKRRKARGEGEECAEVKQDLGESPKPQAESEESEKDKGPEEAAEDSLHVDQTEATEEKQFVCSSCGADSFNSLMSLNFHRNSCVPPDFYDEFPSDIRNRNRGPGVSEPENITESSINSPNISPGTPSSPVAGDVGEVEPEDSSSSAASTRLTSSGENDNPHDEIQHSNKIFNSSAERQGTAENRDREVNVKCKDELFVSREENVNNEGAKSGPELHSREAGPAVIDRSGGEGLARTDISQINTAVGGQRSQRIINNENYSETSKLRILDRTAKEREEKSGENYISDERPSKLPKNTEEKIQTGLAMGDEFKKMPQRSAFKKGRLISEI